MRTAANLFTLRQDSAVVGRRRLMISDIPNLAVLEEGQTVEVQPD